MVSGRYKEAVDEFMNLLNGKEEPNEDEIFGLVSSLKKVECFINCHNMGQWDIWESKSLIKFCFYFVLKFLIFGAFYFLLFDQKSIVLLQATSTRLYQT